MQKFYNLITIALATTFYVQICKVCLQSHIKYNITVQKERKLNKFKILITCSTKITVKCKILSDNYKLSINIQFPQKRCLSTSHHHTTNQWKHIYIIPGFNTSYKIVSNHSAVERFVFGTVAILISSLSVHYFSLRSPLLFARWAEFVFWNYYTLSGISSSLLLQQSAVRKKGR